MDITLPLLAWIAALPMRGVFVSSVGPEGGANLPWRVGTSVPINVYEDDRPICQCHDGATAKRIVDGMNLVEGLKASSPSILDLLQKARSFAVSTEQLLDQVINHSGLV